MKQRVLATLLAASLCTACREAPGPYEAVLPPVDSSQGVRLTYSLGRDRAPFWSANSDTVYYSAEGVYPGLPVTKGALVGIHASGGRLHLILPTQQQVTPVRFLGGGAISPDGSSVAYFDLREHVPDPSLQCTYFCTVRDTVATQPSVLAAMMRISPMNGSGDRDTVTIPFAGRYWDPTHQHYGLSGAWVLTAYPYQRLMLGTGAQPFRATWAPDGKRLAFSDGLQLYIYDAATKKAAPIPNTQDAVYPSWSPDGQWIAYSRFLRSDSVVSECLCVNMRSGSIGEEQRRIIFNAPVLGSGAVVVVKPDGSQQRILGPGDMPSWLPDSKGLVFRRGSQLWRAGSDGTEAQPIPFTDGGEEPAVSRDGKRLAFVRVVEMEGVALVNIFNADVWVVPLKVQ